MSELHDRRFFRIVRTNPPTPRDFMSHKALGMPLRHRTARALMLHDGISVYQTIEQATTLAASSPHLGAFLAEIRIPETARVRFDLDTARGGHSTLWGEPEALLALVVSVSPI